MSALWDQLTLTDPESLNNFNLYIKQRELQRLVQFLMALRHDFEGLRGSILHRNPLPSVDSIVSELLAEEIHLKSLDDQKIVTQQAESTFHLPLFGSVSLDLHPSVCISPFEYALRLPMFGSVCLNLHLSV
ncbi:hypothetical protein Tco_0497072 [Tanacetum coccineum]